MCALDRAGYSCTKIKSIDPSHSRGAAVAQWLRCWTLNSRVVSSRPTLGTVRFRSLGNFVYPTLPQSTQLQMSTNTVWKVPAMD